MSSKLDEIQAYLAHSDKIPWLRIQTADAEWLIARARHCEKLETALQFYENIETYKGDWDHCPMWNDFGIKAREALKES